MERLSLRPAMLLLTIISIVAPATNMMSSSVDSNNPSVESSLPGMPAASSKELKSALLALMDSPVVSPPVRNVRPASDNILRSRDPFRLPPPPSIPTALDIPMPVVTLLGLVQSSAGNVATLEIGGNVITLKEGESALGAILVSIQPPDAATIRSGPHTKILRVM